MEKYNQVIEKYFVKYEEFVSYLFEKALGKSCGEDSLEHILKYYHTVIKMSPLIFN